LRNYGDVEATVTSARDRVGDFVRTSPCQTAFPPAFTKRTKRVRRLTALAEREEQCLRRHRHIAMTKLARIFDPRGKIRETLDQIFPHPPGMQGSAATGEHDATDIA